MYYRNITPTGAVIKPQSPITGLYYNVLLTDKRHGIFPGAVAPFGGLSPTAETDKFVLLEGVSPCTYLPTDAEKIDLTSYQEHVETLLGMMDWNFNKPVDTARNAVMDAESFMKNDCFEVAADAEYLRVMTQMTDYIWWVTRMQDYITRLPVRATVTPEPIGLMALATDSKGHGKQPIRPRGSIKMKDGIKMEMHVPQADLPMRLMREISKWDMLVGAAAKSLYEAVAKWTPKKFNLMDSDFVAYAAYSKGAYNGFNTAIDDNIKYSAEDVYQKTFPALTMPFSDFWPDFSVTNRMVDQKGFEILKHMIIYNILLTLASARVGGRLTGVQYLFRKGNYYIMKSMIQRYLVDPLDMGGATPFWMQPAVNTHLEDGVFFPSLIYPGDSEWELNTQNKAESFSDLVVDRGEADIPDLETLNQNFRVVNTRDSRVQTVKERGKEYLIMTYRMQQQYGSEGYPRPEEVLMTYLTNPTLKPKGAVWVSPHWLRPKFAYVLNPVPLVTMTDGTKKRALPGGITPGDVEAGAMTDAGGKAAMQRAITAAEESTTAVSVTHLQAGRADTSGAGEVKGPTERDAPATPNEVKK